MPVTRIVSTFNPKDWDAFVRRNVESWLELTPFEVVLYHEGEQPEMEHERLIWRQWEHIPEALEFVEEAAGFRAARGMFKTYDYNYDAWKFSRKVFAQADAADEEADLLIWFDADVEVSRPILTQTLENLLGGMPLARYERPGYHSETGIVIWDMRDGRCSELFRHYVGLYKSRQIYKLPQGWHDCWALDCIVRAMALPTANLTKGTGTGPSSLHVVPNSELGQYLRHDKGNRKRVA